jgi:hypothetical protein
VNAAPSTSSLAPLFPALFTLPHSPRNERDRIEGQAGADVIAPVVGTTKMEASLSDRDAEDDVVVPTTVASAAILSDAKLGPIPLGSMASSFDHPREAAPTRSC